MMFAPSRFDAEEILDGLLRWVRIESPTIAPDAVNRMMDVAAADLAGLGARIERIAGQPGYGDVVKAHLDGQSEGPGILVLAHLDTVHPLGTIEGKLRIRREGDRAYGPGIMDMKGGTWAALVALREVRRQMGRTPLPVTFMLIPDEEVGSPSSRALIEEEALRHKLVLVPEPTHGTSCVTGRHAILRFWVTTHGRPAHAGTPSPEGKSAIRVMARLIEEIEAGSRPERGITYRVGIVGGGIFVNVIAIECRAQVLCVAPDEAAFAEIRQRMAGLEGERDGVRVEVTSGPVRPLFEASPGTMALYEKARGFAAQMDLELEHGQFGGGSDGNFTGAIGIPTLDGLGVVGAGLHTFGEHIIVSELPRRTALLASLLASLD
ncbi:M20/M25/M40 family metallo-hydrolase [Marinimicrococcus flavescens]|uniref:M20/M25/M40 family metallo-hydrolase n=1 Tax=Marinimicrococcus flavescens TaxID=3031815 RepID=A0AAP3UZU5_9PROT|nr:M20/M25/M40 family metallo-hydrolase [Marinimicrococcus flavescens]